MNDLRSYFGFHTLPFTREITVEQCFELPWMSQALQALQQVVDQRMSAVLVAPAGTGKTTLLRALRHRLPEARFRIHYIKVTDLSKRDFCREIASAVGAVAAGSYPTLVRRLQDHFRATVDIDSLRPVVLLDEAHDVRPEVLAILRILTNFEMDSQLVVSLILSGQPRLLQLLRRDDLQDVARRMVQFVALRPLSREETQRYLIHRLNIAGNKAKTCPFDEGAIDAIFEIARGNLRAIDVLARATLQVALEAGAPVADSSQVVEARKRVIP